MATKKKPPGWRDRAVKTARAHPVVTWSTAAAIAAVLAVIVPGVVWVDGHYQTAEAAELHAQKDSQAQVVQMYEVQGIKSLILGDRVIKCRARSKDAPDRATCTQAELDYKKSTDRERDLDREVRKLK